MILHFLRVIESVYHEEKAKYEKEKKYKLKNSFSNANACKWSKSSFTSL